MRKTTKADIVCIIVFLLLLAVAAIGGPWAQEQKTHHFNVAPDTLLTLWVKPCLLLFGGYCFQWLLAGLFVGEPRLRAGVKAPLLAVCGLLTAAWPVLVLLHWHNPLGFSIPGVYPLVLLYLQRGQSLPFLIGAGWYAATRRSQNGPSLM